MGLQNSTAGLGGAAAAPALLPGHEGAAATGRVFRNSSSASISTSTQSRLNAIDVVTDHLLIES